MTDSVVTIDITQEHDYRARNEFKDGAPSLISDEPPPLGSGAGPSPVQMLASAVGNCLLNSLLFALRKYKQTPEPLSCHVEAVEGRNAAGRIRVLGLHATLKLGVPAAKLEHLDRALAQFEDFCTVTGSVRSAVPVEVSVLDSDGVRLK